MYICSALLNILSVEKKNFRTTTYSYGSISSRNSVTDKSGSEAVIMIQQVLAVVLVL